MNKQELQKLFVQCKKDVKDIIPIQYTFPNIKINKCVTSLGRCRTFAWCKNEKFQIELSEHLLKCDKELIKNVIYHELIHTCKGCFNHGRNFLYYAYLLNQKLNAKIETKNTDKQFGNKIQYKYKLTCEKCGSVFYRHKLPKFRNNLRHGSCNGSLIIEQLY